MYFVKTPNIIRFYFKDYIWSVDTDKKELYLTFDDGPTPEVTLFVLNTLKKYNAKATFFCIGKNIENHSDLFKQIINNGHAVGNHSQNHLKGWKVNNTLYANNVENCQNIISKQIQEIKDYPDNYWGNTKKLFRPPYGKIKKSQAKILSAKGCKIVMWTVLSGDFDLKIDKKKCLQNVINNSKLGSIIVFHDSKKAYPHLKYTLPKVLEYFTKKGYVFKAL
jgi:peptidoglycan/xylan/chitin deacetylase (PgdA/CDA1 family)